jgi:hypothetical protein
VTSGYTKLFNRIVHSTIWREPNEVRILWITMLAMADQDGVVYCTVPGLADVARVTLDQCEHALEKFQQPDRYSWSQEDEGRRIRTVDGGWLLINHEKYRALMGTEDRREKARIRQQKHRNAMSQTVTPTSHDVTENNACNDIQKQIQIQKHKQEVNTAAPDWVPFSAWQDFVEMRKKIKKPLTDKARILAWTLLAKLMAEGNDPIEVLNQSILNNWAGLFPVGDRRNGNGAGISKAEQLVNKNRAAIIDGLGLGSPSR